MIAVTSPRETNGVGDSAATSIVIYESSDLSYANRPRIAIHFSCEQLSDLASNFADHTSSIIPRESTSWYLLNPGTSNWICERGMYVCTSSTVLGWLTFKVRMHVHTTGQTEHWLRSLDSSQHYRPSRSCNVQTLCRFPYQPQHMCVKSSYFLFLRARFMHYFDFTYNKFINIDSWTRSLLVAARTSHVRICKPKVN